MAGRSLLLFALAALLCLTGSRAVAEQAANQPPLPQSDAPLAEAVVRADADLSAQRARSWRSDEHVRYLLLERDVRFELGVYGFKADRAVVRIVIEPRPGRSVHHLALYLEGARGLRGRGPVIAEGERLLVTAATTGRIALEADLLDPLEEAPDVDLVEAALERMQRRDAQLARRTRPAPEGPLFDPEVWERRAAERRRVELPTPLRVDPPPADVLDPQRIEPETPELEPTVDVEAPPEFDDRPRDQILPPAPATADTGVLPATGTVRFAADRVVFERRDRESHLMLIGNVRLFYDDRENDRRVTLQTERAVVFLPGRDEDQAEPAQQIDAGIVRGVYLEDNAVITDGEYTVRAPRIFYDLPLNQAILLEAVAYTYDIERQLPIYMRADVVRQTSRHSFEARRALLTTSAFAEPHFAIGARRLTFEQRETPEGEPQEWVTAQDTTFRVGPMPVFYWPYVSAPAVSPPIRSVSTGYSDRTGFEVQTRWDLFALVGHPDREHIDAAGDLDYRGDHGAGLGLEIDYDPDPISGGLRGYLLPYDTGTDHIGGRDDIEHDGETRGFVRWRHRHDLADDWQLRLESAYVSDETFLEEFFRDEAFEARPYETSAYLSKREQDWQLDLLAKTHLNDFTPQLTQLQSPGYQVEKLPELGYYRVGTSFWDDRLTWYSENRLSRMRADVGDDAPADRGFGQTASQELFGIDSDTTFEQAAADAGLPDDWRLRLDTRQEITAPIAADGFDITPYAAGRLTLYDDDFEDYQGETDQHRLVGSVGTRLGTELARTYDAGSDLLNLNGLRHIVEPEIDLFYVGSTLNSEKLPVYDPEVEAITKGAGLRLGLTQTFQTRRGGEGRWRSVDWLTLQTDLVLRSSDADVDAPIPRFYSYRPEFSHGGDHFYTRAVWMVTDTLGATGELTHNLEHDHVAQWRVGSHLDHSARLRSFVNYSEIDAFNSRLLTYGFNYQLTTKYRLGMRHQLDFGDDESRRVRVTLDRRWPQARLQVFADFDQIDDEQMVGVVFTPVGLGQGSAISPNLFGR